MNNPSEEKLFAAIEAASAPGGEPVAWRWRTRHPADAPGFVEPWCVTGYPPPPTANEVQPLYAAPQAAPAPLPLTEAQMLDCVRSVGQPAPMGLTRDRGPYEVTEPTWFLIQLIRAIERAHGITATPAKEQAMPQYADRDHKALGDHYIRHVNAMTAEGLHRKSAIAAELAWRDAEITRLRAALAAASERK